MNMTALAVAAGVGVAFAATVWLFWPKIGSWFRDSETLFWARLQVAAGAILGAVAVTDITPIFQAFGLAKWTPVYLVASGLLTEVLRRSRATDL
jgi:hypothetical protein